MPPALYHLDNSHFCLCPDFEPSGHQIWPASLAINKQTAILNTTTLKMPPAALHNAAHTPIAKRLVSTERALLHGAFESMLKPLDEPGNFQAHACEDYGVEMAVGVFEGQGIRVGKVGAYLDVEFRGESH